MHKRNVLVFPAGTEIGLEVFAALRHCKEVKLFGAGQDISSHGRFAFPEYYHIPSIHEEGWLDELITLCERLAINYIFPAYDDVIVELSRHQERIPARVLTSPTDTCEITRSKSLTYKKLMGHLRVPVLYDDPYKIESFPVLVKPDRGQGSFGVHKIHNREELFQACDTVPGAIISEYLPGEEYTVDCFSDREKGVLFARARCRRRTRNGISVNTISEDLGGAFELAQRINHVLQLRGAWFFQLKRARDGELALLEVAPRIAGAMATHRVMGVNFCLLSIFEEERLPISILTNSGGVELDRALVNRYQHSIRFSTLYIDLDDTLILNERVNVEAVRLIFQCINQGKKIKLITRHSENLSGTLIKHRLNGIFDEVIHLQNKELKSAYVKEVDAIFIDDSFLERQDVYNVCGIPTFDCSMIELLWQQAECLNGVNL
jgi:carbamoyl-phosphate synthase large subunit